jgi:hypothetical protein
MRGVQPPRWTASGSAGFEEQRDDGRVPGARRRVERRAGHPSRAPHVRIGAARQQQADGLVLPEERGEVQRGESVAAPASRQVRVVGEEDGEPVEVAERRGLEGIERGDPSLDGLDERPVAAIPGAEQRGHTLVIPRHREGRVRVQRRPDAIDVPGIDRREQVLGCACHGATFSLRPICLANK